MGMRRNNKLKIPDAVRRGIRQQARSGQLKGIGPLDTQITDQNALHEARSEQRASKRVVWSFALGDMVKWVTGYTRGHAPTDMQMGMIVGVKDYGSTTYYQVSGPGGLVELPPEKLKLVDRLD